MNNYLNVHLNIYIRLFFKKKKVKFSLSILGATETESGYNTRFISFCSAMIAKSTALMNRPENNFRQKFNKSFISICYLHDFLPCSFHIILVLDEVMIEAIGFDVRKSFLVRFSVPFKCLMKNFVDKVSFIFEILFVQFVLVIHRS